MARATINDVATSAGVSTATVSRLLNGLNVSSGTADRIWKAVAELDYTPNALTRGVFAGRSSTIGVIIRDLDSPYYLELMRGIEEAATAHDSLVMFANTFSRVDREWAHVQKMDEQRVRGLILTTGPDSDARARRMAAAGTPCVIVGRAADLSPNLHSISLDNIKAGQLIGGHLLACGRSSIAVITMGNREQGILRIRGLRSVLNEHDIELPDSAVRAVEAKEEVFTAIAELLADARANGSPIDAVVCMSDLLTRHIYEALHKLGRRVPDDVGLIAVGDFDWAETLGMTVIAQPTYEMGLEAATLIVTAPQEPVRIVQEPRLIVRRSCGEE
ncbi:LacI family DNA-binding transcriptional regulator [Arthrobacter sp. 2RAF6]|uniref:LacI family DNA-binding transcriptional regulator n=1 Tax=Arthrobacter sp. 2RAF6 TaxID=3233002 RepID=UPI003F90D960